MKIKEINSAADIPKSMLGTPVETLIRCHNFGEDRKQYDNAEILVGMCMDNRKVLRVPDNFAYVIRTAGGSMKYSDFVISYAVAVGQIKAIAIIGHDDCGMCGLHNRKESYIQGLVNAGWDKDTAEQHFDSFSPIFEIGNEEDFVISEVKRIKNRYEKLYVAPLFYRMSDGMLSYIDMEE
jgi:carbonic anhydrase